MLSFLATLFHRQVIGVHYTDTSLTAVLVEDRTFKNKHVCSLPTGTVQGGIVRDTAAFVGAIREARSALLPQEIEEISVVLLLPSSVTYVAWVQGDVPHGQTDLDLLLGKAFPEDPGTLTAVSTSVKGGHDELLSILCAVRTEVLQELTNAFVEANLTPTRVTTFALALHHAAQQHVQRDVVTLLVNREIEPHGIALFAGNRCVDEMELPSDCTAAQRLQACTDFLAEYRSSALPIADVLVLGDEELTAALSASVKLPDEKEIRGVSLAASSPGSEVSGAYVAALAAHAKNIPDFTRFISGTRWKFRLPSSRRDIAYLTLIGLQLVLLLIILARQRLT